MLLILGQGYVGNALAEAALRRGIETLGVRRTAAENSIAADDPALAVAMDRATHIVACAPPAADGDPFLAAHGDRLAGSAAWTGYLSSTGVYGDAGGAWVDEGAAIVGQGASGRRTARAAAEGAWRRIGATLFRLPGIYGPGRSVFDQLRAGTARRIDRPGHRFSRIHVDDIVEALLLAMEGRTAGLFNLADALPAEPRALVEEACRRAGRLPPPLQRLEDAGLSPQARAFWSERRLVSGAAFRRLTGFRLRHPDYKDGLESIWKKERETGCSTGW